MDPNDVPAGDAGSAGAAGPVTKLTDAQVFARDPEDYSEENTADTIARLRKILERQRRARQDSQAVAEEAAKLKKANAKTKKPKKAPGKVAADPMETII